MKEERLARYKELCAKAKEAPLSEDELAEQGALRLEFCRMESGIQTAARKHRDTTPRRLKRIS